MHSVSPLIGRDPDSTGGDGPPAQGHPCPACGEALDRTQPDPADFNRLIGICHGCDSWHLITLNHRTGLYELRGPFAGETTAA